MSRAYLYVLIAVALWGWNIVLIGDLVTRFPPLELMVIRYGVALVLTLVFRKVISPPGKRAPVPSGRSKFSYSLLAMSAGLALALATITQLYGVRLLGKPAHAAFLTGLVALFVPLIQVAMRTQTFRLRAVALPVILAFAGTALMCRFSLPTLGDLLVIGCAFFYAVQALINGSFKRFVSPVFTLSYTCLSCIVVALLFFVFVDSTVFVLPASLGDYAGLAVLSVLSTFLPWALLLWSQQIGGVAPYRVGILYALEPVFALMLVWPLGLEDFSAAKLIGCFLILVANERMLKVR